MFFLLAIHFNNLFPDVSLWSVFSLCKKKNAFSTSTRLFVRNNVKMAETLGIKVIQLVSHKIGEMFLTSFAGRPLFPSMPGLPWTAEEIKRKTFCYMGLNVDSSTECDHKKCLKDGSATWLLTGVPGKPGIPAIPTRPWSPLSPFCSHTKTIVWSIKTLFVQNNNKYVAAKREPGIQFT